MSENNLHFETLQIHGGYHIDETCARGIAIHPTAAYHFPSCKTAAGLFTLSEAGNIYTRLQNPTSSSYERRMAALYGGVGALAVSSGMSALLIALTSLASAGENIVSSPYLYGGTHNQFTLSLRKLGIDCRLAHGDAPEELEAEVRAVIAQVGATSVTQMGKVMGVASKRLAGRADGKDISAKVRELLS